MSNDLILKKLTNKMREDKLRNTVEIEYKTK